jgi:Ca2+-binding EF-hand superfamily protein
MRVDVVEGCASYDSIRNYLQRRGYSPLKQVIVEILEEVHPDWRTGTAVDACQLYDFMLVFNKRDGFGKQQLAGLVQAFDDFDADNSREISVLELSKMLRYLGYGLNTPEAHTIVLKVDENDSGQLDLREFMRLMRLMREAECRRIKEVFDSCADPKGRMPGSRVEEALEMLKHDPPDKTVVFYEAFLSLDFDDFIGVVDSARDGFVKKERKKAGFTEEELQYFQHVYTSCDKDGNGIMSALELLEVLNEFGWAPTTKEEQAVLIGRMHEAKMRAEDAGITGLKEDEMDFWVYVQLLRLLHDEQDRLQEERNQELQAELRFCVLEVDQFRQVFRGYARKNENFTTSLDSRQSPYLLSGSAMKRIIHSLGVQMSWALEEKLEKKMTSLVESSVLDLDFNGFLRLMRWLLDTNFGRINDVVVSKPEGDD